MKYDYHLTYCVKSYVHTKKKKKSTHTEKCRVSNTIRLKISVSGFESVAVLNCREQICLMFSVPEIQLQLSSHTVQN